MMNVNMTPKIAPIRVRCPVCDAKAGEPCKPEPLQHYARQVTATMAAEKASVN